MKRYISLCRILVTMCILCVTACGIIPEQNKIISEKVINSSNTITENKENRNKESSDEFESSTSETETKQSSITIDDVYTLLSNCVPANTIQNITVSEEAKNVFAQYLSEQDYIYGISFADTNADGNAEMIISLNPYGLTDIVYFGSNNINTVHIETASDRGLVRFLTDANGNVIVVNRYDYGNHTTDMGCQLWYIYTIDKKTNMLSDTIKYFRMSYNGYVDDFENADKYYGDAFINDMPITESQSNDLLEYLTELSGTVPPFSCTLINYLISYEKIPISESLSYEECIKIIEDICD